MNKYKDKIAIISFYSFVPIEDVGIIQAKMLLIGKKKSVKGTILLASEGFNGSLSGSEEAVNEVFDHLVKITNAGKITAFPRLNQTHDFKGEASGAYPNIGEADETRKNHQDHLKMGNDIMYKINYCSQHPFSKYKVRLKKEIVTLGIPELDVENLKGDYISPEEWDEYLKKEDTILIDTRNDYEVSMGTFKSAVDPVTGAFRDFPAWVEENKEKLENKTILMCCTGGIRCEKSTAYMKSVGFEKVYHLKGGILQYLEDTGNKNQMWHGDCFVFDDRIAVDENLKPNILFSKDE
jgi:UPF0176 protein